MKLLSLCRENIVFLVTIFFLRKRTFFKYLTFRGVGSGGTDILFCNVIGIFYMVFR